MPHDDVSDAPQVSRRRYASLDDIWPAQLRPPGPQEAISAARRLWRKFASAPFSGAVRATSGNRYTAIRRGVLYVNPDCKTDPAGGGWRSLVHDLSHLVHARVHRKAKAHAAGHVWYEREMARYVVAQGWLDGRLARPARPAPDPDMRRRKAEARLRARLARWEAKQRRATRAIAKLKRSLRAMERRCASSGVRCLDK